MTPDPMEIRTLTDRMCELQGQALKDGDGCMDLGNPAHADVADTFDALERQATFAEHVHSMVMNGRVLLAVTGVDMDGNPTANVTVIPIDVFAPMIDSLIPGFVIDVMQRVDEKLDQVNRYLEGNA